MKNEALFTMIVSGENQEHIRVATQAIEGTLALSLSRNGLPENSFTPAELFCIAKHLEVHTAYHTSEQTEFADVLKLLHDYERIEREMGGG